MRRRRVVLCAVGVVAAQFVLAGATAGIAVPAPPGLPSAQPAAPLPMVGAVFPDGAGEDHSCTGAVLDSPSRDLVLTAAHCLAGTGAGVQFAPGYDRGPGPDGVWQVDAVFLTSAWADNQDPAADYALLRIAPRQDRWIEDVTGGLTLDTTLATRVAVVGYAAGRGDPPLRCEDTVFRTDGYPTFECQGFPGGTSGSPWMPTSSAGRADPRVVGIIGGFEQGGCVDFTSYSPPFGPDLTALVKRAAGGGPGDEAPAVPNLLC